MGTVEVRSAKGQTLQGRCTPKTAQCPLRSERDRIAAMLSEMSRRANGRRGEAGPHHAYSGGPAWRRPSKYSEAEARSEYPFRAFYRNHRAVGIELDDSCRLRSQNTGLALRSEFGQ